MKKRVFKSLIGTLFCLMMVIMLVPLSGAKADTGDVAINATNFPDAKFRNYLSEEFDTNKDGKLTKAERELVNVIDISYTEISDLKGIGYFMNLDSLYCSGTKLSSLDVSKNTSLTFLMCADNSLTSLDLSRNTALERLYCQNNQLTSLNLSSNTSLEYFDCQDNKLTSLNFGNITTLKEINFGGNELTSIDLSKNLDLTYVFCAGNMLTGLDVSKNVDLRVLQCYDNKIPSLDVSKNTDLEELHCQYNLLKAIDVSNNTKLKVFFCYRNQIEKLDISKNSLLIFCDCEGNGLTSLNVSNNPNLETFACDGNKITSLDISNSDKLVETLMYGDLTEEGYIRYDYQPSEGNGWYLMCDVGVNIIYDNVKLSITSQPKNTEVEEGELAYFEVVAKGNGIKYLWQYKNAGASSWTDWTSKTTANISVAYAAQRNGMSVRCILTDSKGNKLTSNSAVLTYRKPLAIITHPSDATVNENEIAYFSVKATGSGLTYLWQYKEKGKTTWTDWTSKTTASISVAYASYRNGMSLRCKVSDSKGKEIVSNAATLTYIKPFSITEHPVDTSVYENELAYFSVKAVGSGLKYLWQYKEKGKTAWINWNSKTTADISVAYASYRNGMSFRCVVTDSTGKSLTSNAAVLTYTKKLAITVQPQSTLVLEGEMAYFSIKAIGSGLKYLWQYKLVGSATWVNWTSKTTPDISVAYLKTRNNMQLRCVVADSNGRKLTSNEVVLMYKKPLAITSQPVSATVPSGNLANFSVKATGSGLTYLWQYKMAGSSEWVDWTSKTTASISVAYLPSRNGMSLRCKVKNDLGEWIISNVVTLNYE